jgi:putative inorganic carbon (hco3(-)) transporter
LMTDILKNFPRIRRPTLIPIVLVLSGLFWAFLVGLWNYGLVSATIGAVEWFSGPLLFCFMALSGKKVDYHRLGNWVTSLIVVQVVYGLYQWAEPPPWDAKWLVDSLMTSSMGAPFPFMMRTFGTLNSTGIYSFICAYYLIAGIGWKRYVPVAVFTIAALATTLVRAAWIIAALGMALALILQGGPGRIKTIIKLGMIGGILVLAGAPLVARFDVLSKRFETLGNLSNDGSYNERHTMMVAAINTLLDTPEGAGLGSVGRGAKVTKKGIEGLDNGFIAITFMLGWAGAALYLGGFFFVAVWAIATGDANIPERAAMGGLVIVLFVSNAFGPSFSDIGGVICWSSLGIVYLACIGKESQEAAAEQSPAAA